MEAWPDPVTGRAGREVTVIRSRQEAARGRQAWGYPLLLAFGLSFLLLPAPAWPNVFTWVDERGIQHFVGDAAYIPEQFRDRARLFIASTGPGKGETAPGPPEAPFASQEGTPASPAPMLQGAFAVSLAERLGLAHLPTAPDAAAILAQRGILPPGGWVLGAPITPGWLAALARSVLAASSAGLIPQAPGEAFAILEALAAAVGVALVPIEPPPPSQPLAVEVPAQAVILESVVVSPLRFHHGRFVLDRHFRKRVPTDRGDRDGRRRPPTLSRRQPAEDEGGRFHRLGNGLHRIGSGFHRLESSPVRVWRGGR